MSCTRLFGGLLAGAFLFHALGGPVAAQCTTCAVPAVTYAAAYAPAPAVYQTNRPTTGWYPGALLDRMRMNRWSARSAYTTAYAPAPTYATAYTAAYTPTYPPSYHAAAYRPAYPMSYSASYAPTVAYSPVAACATCSVDPCSVDPCACSSRAVVMRAIDSSCCDSGYVGQAAYVTPATPDCAGCATSATSTYVVPSNPPPASPVQPQQQPRIAPTEAVPEQREVQRPEETSVLDPEPVQEPPVEDADPMNGTDASAPSTLLQPPQLFDPGDRVTKRLSVPVWTAVYHSRSATGQNTSQPVAQTQAARPTAADAQRDAQGWSSAGR